MLSTTSTTNKIVRMNRKKPFSKKKLSIIFKGLPDMLKQQVLEFIGFDPNAPFIFNYARKFKTIVKMVNPEFMKEALRFRIRNPPAHLILTDNDNVHVGDAYTIITPRQIQAYTIFAYTINENYHLEIDDKYKKYIRQWNKITKFIDLIRSQNQNPNRSHLTKEEEMERKHKMDIRYYQICFCDPKSKFLNPRKKV